MGNGSARGRQLGIAAQQVIGGMLDLQMRYVDHIVGARKWDEVPSLGEKARLRHVGKSWLQLWGDDYELLGGAGRS